MFGKHRIKVRKERALLLRNRPPAKDLCDVELDEKMYAADFQIGEKYSSYSSEIIRLTLLGIAGYGFIISNILMKLKEIDNKAQCSFFKNQSIRIYVIIFAAAGIAAFGISLGLSLYHRLKITSCLYDQILASRSMLRMKNPNWSDLEKQHEMKILQKVREYQTIEGKRYENILMWASRSLFIGFASVIIIFFIVVINTF